jgi:uncharacterized membrane protein YbaN (DUF454 family)
MSFLKTTLRVSGLIGRLLPGLAAGAFLVTALVAALRGSKEKKQQG